jgi:hypothetical protein
MITSPFRFEQNLAEHDYRTLGVLLLRWSHIEHMLAHCLKLLLGLNDDQAVTEGVFRRSTRQRLKEIRILQKSKGFPTAHAERAFRELDAVMEGLLDVRDHAVHAVLINHETGDARFESRLRGSHYTKAQVFETEELTKYAGHAAWLLRHELGDIDRDNPAPGPLPARPQIPEFLKEKIEFK